MSSNAVTPSVQGCNDRRLLENDQRNHTAPRPRAQNGYQFSTTAIVGKCFSIHSLVQFKLFRCPLQL